MQAENPSRVNNTISNMSSTEFSLQSALRSLREEGFVVLDELAVGEHVTTMEQRDFSFLSPYGLDYCNAHILNNPVRFCKFLIELPAYAIQRVRAVIESLLPTCRLGHWLRYQALPGHIECFRRGGVKAGMRVLVVQQWAKGSRAAFHSGSHLHDLPTEKGERSLHETTQLALTTAGCKASEWDFPHGGL